jgi:hypothetical protein
LTLALALAWALALFLARVQALGLCEEVLQEEAVLALVDAITNGAGTSRHRKVLAEGVGELSTGVWRQGQDAVVEVADLIGAKGLQAWISSGDCCPAPWGRLCPTWPVLGVGAGRLQWWSQWGLGSCLLACWDRYSRITGLYSPSLG